MVSASTYSSSAPVERPRPRMDTTVDCSEPILPSITALEPDFKETIACRTISAVCSPSEVVFNDKMISLNGEVAPEF